MESLCIHTYIPTYFPVPAESRCSIDHVLSGLLQPPPLYLYFLPAKALADAVLLATLAVRT